MKQISESEISSAVDILQTIYSFLNTSVAGRFGELQAFLGTNVLGALIPAGTVDSDEEGLQLIQLRKADVQNLISTLSGLSDVSSGGSTSDTCADLINAINNLSNQSSTIRNIIRNELQLNNTNIISPINTNIDSSRETLVLQIYQGFSTVITGINTITGTLANITDTLTTINARTIQIYEKIIDVLNRIADTREELKQTANRVIQIWNCIHTPESTVDNPLCRPTGTGGGTVDLTDVIADLNAILACCSGLDTYLKDFDVRVTADFVATRNYINDKSTDIITDIDSTKTLVTLANTRILNTQVTLNQINTKIDNLPTGGGGGGTLPDGIGDVIYNTYNEVNNIKNTVNNTYSTVNQNRTTITNVNNTLNNVYYNTQNIFDTINNLYNTVNNTYNQLSSIYNTVTNLYQTVNNTTNNTYNTNDGSNNQQPNCTVNIMGVNYPCSSGSCDLTPVLNAIKALRDELIKNVNKELNINDCDGVSNESFLVSGYSFSGVFNYFDGVIKKLDNIQTIVCADKKSECVPVLIEPSELPIGFTKETQMFVTWESESGSRWHSTLWNINPDILNKLKTKTWTDEDWTNYFGITINRGHKATKQFAYLDVKYIDDKYKKIVFYLASISECSRLFNWINSKWILSGIDYKSTSIDNIQSFPTYAQSYIYSVAIQEYVDGIKTDKSYCVINPNI